MISTSATVVTGSTVVTSVVYVFTKVTVEKDVDVFVAVETSVSTTKVDVLVTSGLKKNVSTLKLSNILVNTYVTVKV